MVAQPFEPTKSPVNILRAMMRQAIREKHRGPDAAKVAFCVAMENANSADLERALIPPQVRERQIAILYADIAAEMKRDGLKVVKGPKPEKVKKAVPLAHPAASKVSYAAVTRVASEFVLDTITVDGVPLRRAQVGKARAWADVQQQQGRQLFKRGRFVSMLLHSVPEADNFKVVGDVVTDDEAQRLKAAEDIAAS